MCRVFVHSFRIRGCRVIIVYLSTEALPALYIHCTKIFAYCASTFIRGFYENHYNVGSCIRCFKLNTKVIWLKRNVVFCWVLNFVFFSKPRTQKNKIRKTQSLFLQNNLLNLFVILVFRLEICLIKCLFCRFLHCLCYIICEPWEGLEYYKFS